MSKKIVDTKMPGYYGPRAVSTVQLQDTFEKSGGGNAFSLKKACKIIPGFQTQFRPTTKDGYGWFWAHDFQTENGIIAVFIPWFQDWDNKDGSNADRAIAIYTQGRVADEEIETLLQQFSEAIQKVNRERKEKVSIKD